MKSIALNILDIIQNSIDAGADRIALEITDSIKEDNITVTIRDNGRGMSKELLEKATDPFVTTRKTRRTGFGLPLMKYHAELTGGYITIESGINRGTNLIVRFVRSHIDRQPLGDIPGMLTILIGANRDIEFLYTHETDEGVYSFSTEETKDYLGIKTLCNNTLLKEIGEMVSVNLEEIGVSELKFKD
ncbi:MAG: ATP-binding protein [Bacteroidales bacterium]